MLDYIVLYYCGALIISMATPTSPAECPRTCECKWKSGKESVFCNNSNLTTVPPGLDSGTQILDLTDNVITTLRHQEFSKAGLVNLQKIFLAKCRLKSIEKFAFENLINLIDLDLSYNLLTTIPSSNFQSIPEIRELRLNGNPIQIIANNAFINTTKLVRLELSECKIASIEPNAFLGLEDSLEWLKLDTNKLLEVDASSFAILRNLHGLELAGNPWNCSCKLRDLREWMLKQNVPYDIPPICYGPKRLLEKSWKVLDLDEFACPPKIFANEIKARGMEGTNVTLFCTVEGIPRPNVKWLLRNRVITNVSSPVIKKLYTVNQKITSSELIIHAAEIQDSGVYVCAAENKAGKSEAAVTLTMSKRNSDVRFSQKALVVSVFLGVTSTVLCCLLAACFVSVRKKRLLKWHTAECRREDNYEKIEMSRKGSHRNLNGGMSGDPVTVTRKNGDYCVVPGTDTDHEHDEEEESTLEITTPGTSNDRDARDNAMRNFSSTCGTYKSPSAENVAIRTSALTHNSIYVTGVSSVRQVPDVIGNSKCVSGRAQSANGSASDIQELFCTLPGKRDVTRYESSDSRSLLLPESRYGSDSTYDDRYPARKSKPTSGSVLNLTNLNSTPLLDVRALETQCRLSPQQYHFQDDSQASGAANAYDYHAAQLEKFLEEYRVLQKQLTRMKETCDNICQGQTRDPAPPCTTDASGSALSSSWLSRANLNNRTNSSNSNAIQDSVDFKNFENELTKYLMSRSPSTAKSLASGTLHN